MKLGSIYKIVCAISDDVYIGSTFNDLAQRFKSHKAAYKKGGFSIYEYFERYGLENFRIILIKKYQVVDRKQLLAYEQLWINKLRNINKLNPFNPVIKCHHFQSNEKRKVRQSCYECNTEAKQYDKKRSKIYRQKNLEKIKGRMLEYQKKEEVIEMRRGYALKQYHQNAKTIIECVCGSKVKKPNYTEHTRAKKHIKFLKENH